MRFRQRVYKVGIVKLGVAWTGGNVSKVKYREYKEYRKFKNIIPRWASYGDTIRLALRVVKNLDQSIVYATNKYRKPKETQAWHNSTLPEHWGDTFLSLSLFMVPVYAP